jgi:hypothetical protein
MLTAEGTLAAGSGISCGHAITHKSPKQIEEANYTMPVSGAKILFL